MKISLPFSRRHPRALTMLAAAGVALSLVAATAHAQTSVINDFESGAFGPDASSLGDASVVGASFFTPASGTQQALLTTFSTAADGGNLSGTDATGASAVETFLGLSSNTLHANGASNSDASVLAFVRLTLNVGDVVSFNYNFLTNATAADGQDFSFVTLQRGGAEPTFLRFADASSASLASNSLAFDRETGTQTLFLAPVTTAGIYTLGIGVTDAFDDAVGSGLLIDNVRINAVPEPSVRIGCALAGALGLVVMMKRRRRQGA